MDYVVLFVSPYPLHASALARMLAPVSLKLDHVVSLKRAKNRLGTRPYGAVLTEARLPDGNWTDVLKFAGALRFAPAVLVTDRNADDSFWAEILNLGAYDLLAQPFDSSEVQRILVNACEQLRAKPVMSTPHATPHVLKAAS
ncbi:MAG: hypothetical protein ABSG25_01990 [Bryobacteraceae bacterium]